MPASLPAIRAILLLTDGSVWSEERKLRYQANTTIIKWVSNDGFSEEVSRRIINRSSGRPVALKEWRPGEQQWHDVEPFGQFPGG
jgi:hypothetical protein